MMMFLTGSPRVGGWEADYFDNFSLGMWKHPYTPLYWSKAQIMRFRSLASDSKMDDVDKSYDPMYTILDGILGGGAKVTAVLK